MAPSGEIFGKNFWEEFPGTIYEDSPYQLHYHRAMYERLGGEFEAFYPEPLNRWFLILTRPSPDGVIVFFRDITEVKRAMSALIQNEKLAAVGRLAASIAHEINNPLESVTNLLYLARSSSSNAEEIQEYLQTAERELRRVSAISSQTLRFHKQSTKALPVTFGSLLESVLSIYQGRLVNACVHVEVKERSNQPILCFEGEIRQVLSNLVVNGIDAMPEGGRLLLRSREATSPATGERGLMITVADTGIGMAPHVVGKIFEPFYTTKGDSGTGLGLWVSQEIVQRHGGTLHVRSSRRPGCSGTVFQLYLPFAAALRSEL